MKNLVLLTAIIVLLALVWGDLLQSRERVLQVVDLPEKESFFNETAGSYYDLAYVFPQKTFLGIVVASDYRGGSYALLYQKKDLLPYYLSSVELLQFLAMNDLPTPSKLPSFPLHEYPGFFYIVVSILLFLVLRKPIRFLCISISRKFSRPGKNLKREPYAGYLRRRY